MYSGKFGDIFGFRPAAITSGLVSGQSHPSNADIVVMYIVGGLSYKEIYEVNQVIKRHYMRYSTTAVTGVLHIVLISERMVSPTELLKDVLR